MRKEKKLLREKWKGLVVGEKGTRGVGTGRRRNKKSNGGNKKRGGGKERGEKRVVEQGVRRKEKGS